MAATSVSFGVPLMDGFLSSHKRTRDDELLLAREERWPGWPGDNVFRLLVAAHKVGAIIGRKGEFVKRMCEETKSRIKILDGIPGTAERVVLVSAREEPEAILSPAVDGLLKVHQRITGLIEGLEGYPSTTLDFAGVVSSKFLVAATQAGSLIGKQGLIIKAIQDSSGATVRIMPPEDLPLCALQDDRIVEIHGEPVKVHKAVELVVSHLRKFLLDRSVLPLFELNRAVQAQMQSQAAPQGTWAPVSTPLPTTNPASLGGTSYYDASTFQHGNFYQSSNPLEMQQHHEGVSFYPGVGSAPAAPVITQNPMAGLTVTALPDVGGSYNSLPSNHTYVATPSSSTYNTVPSYTSTDAAYVSYTQQVPSYSTATGTAGGTHGSYSSAYSY